MFSIDREKVECGGIGMGRNRNGEERNRLVLGVVAWGSRSDGGWNGDCLS